MTKPGGRWRRARAYAMFGLIRHPVHGNILIDTGYAPRFYAATTGWPQRAYALTTPTTIDVEQTARFQLGDLKIDQILVTHFHADHIAGLNDFPQAEFIYFREGYAAVRSLSPLQATRAAFIPALLPADFAQRSRPVSLADQVPLPSALSPFERGIDLLGDGSLWGIHLPGHAYGQMGLYLPQASYLNNCQGPLFLAIDACWHSLSYRENRLSHRLANFIQDDSAAYAETLEKIHQMHLRSPSLPILPFHCPEVHRTWVIGST